MVHLYGAHFLTLGEKPSTGLRGLYRTAPVSSFPAERQGGHRALLLCRADASRRREESRVSRFAVSENISKAAEPASLQSCFLFCFVRAMHHSVPCQLRGS